MMACPRSDLLQNPNTRWHRSEDLNVATHFNTHKRQTLKALKLQSQLVGVLWSRCDWKLVTVRPSRAVSA